MAIDVAGLIFAPRSGTHIVGGDLNIPLDMAHVVSHRYRNQVLTAAREDGTTITDHVVGEPEELTIDGLVSDDPLALFSGVVGGAVRELFGQQEDAQRPSLSAWELLRKAWETAALLRVVTSLGTYDDMVVESLETDQTAATAHALRFTLTLRRVYRVRTESILTDLLDVVPGSADRAAATARRGAQPAQTPTASESSAFTAASGAVP